MRLGLGLKLSESPSNSYSNSLHILNKDFPKFSAESILSRCVKKGSAGGKIIVWLYVHVN